MKNNILISAAGKRVSLLQMFQRELRLHYPQAKVYASDVTTPSLAPASYLADGFLLMPKASSANCADEHLRLCKELNIGLIIPTIDTELIPLSLMKAPFREQGIEVVVSDKSFIRICRDKRLTNDFFKEHHINSPAERDKYNPVFPMFAKPYDGSLSKDIFHLRSIDDLTPEIMNHPKLMFMDYVDKKDYKEFTVDMYYGRDNRVKSIVPRERIEVRSGEINKGITRKNYLVEFLLERLGHIPGVQGCICLQLFYNETNNDVLGIEINPRFGGGYPLTFHAKADYVKYIIAEYMLNQTIEYSDNWLDNTLMLRYESEVILYDQQL